MRKRAVSAAVVFETALAILIAMSTSNVYSMARGAGGGPVTYSKSVTSIDPNKMCLPNIVIVKFKPGVTASIQELFRVPSFQKKIVTDANPVSMRPLLQVMHMGLDKASEILNDIYIVHYVTPVTPALMAKSLMTNPNVEYAVPHYIYKVSSIEVTPNDPLIPDQYALAKIQ
ncbi:MAG: hypothetical protein M1339_06030, partial [Bacteroidetes bacterium]|nr:hypothetical protein [Bacteroidota bacterium]